MQRQVWNACRYISRVAPDRAHMIHLEAGRYAGMHPHEALTSNNHKLCAHSAAGSATTWRTHLRSSCSMALPSSRRPTPCSAPELTPKVEGGSCRSVPSGSIRSRQTRTPRPYLTPSGCRETRTLGSRGRSTRCSRGAARCSRRRERRIWAARPRAVSVDEGREGHRPIWSSHTR